MGLKYFEKANKKYKYDKTAPLNSGNTELFSTNLLTLKEHEREITSIWEL